MQIFLIKEDPIMAHIDKKNNQESKKLGQNTNQQLAEMNVEAASEIGFSKHSKKNAKVKNKYS
jgi:hypothetical protein